MLSLSVRLLRRSRCRTSLAFPCMFSCAVRLGKVVARRLAVSVGMLRVAAKVDCVGTCIFGCHKGGLCAATVCASVSAQQALQLVCFRVHVSSAVYSWKVLHATFRGLRGCAAYRRQRGLRGYSNFGCVAPVRRGGLCAVAVSP